MGQAAGLILGAAGAVIGGIYGGPMGAEAGFMIGSTIGTLLFPKKGPTPPDLRVSDSAYGKWIPSVWGRYRLSGNLIWIGTPHSHSSGSGGKGAGGKGGNQPYTTLSFAHALCKGPIGGITRIWANGKLIYDVSNPSDWRALSGSSSMVTNWTIYFGDEEQMPDPLMESYTGANTPAYRGMAYVVFNELNLQQWGNYMPSLTYEVQAAGGENVSSSISATASEPPLADTGDGGWWPSSIGGGGAVSGVVSRTYQSGASLIGQWAGFTLSAYGSQFSSVTAQNLGLNLMSAAYQTYDQDGQGRVLLDTGALYGSGSYYSPGHVPGAGLLTFSQGRALIANGNVYASAQINGGWYNYVNMASMPYQATHFSVMLGATAGYLWVIDQNNHLLQLDLGGHLVADHGATPGTGNVGVAYADDEIYTASNAGAVYLFNGSTWETMPFQAPPYWAQASLMSVQENMVVLAGGNQVELKPFATNTSATTGQIIADVCAAAALQPTQYDVTQMTDTVVGFASTSNSSPRDILQPLLATYFIDVGDSDGLLKFVRRGAAPVDTIPWDDLGADAQSNSSAAQNPITETIAQEFELPRSETLSYLSASTDYQTVTQRAFKGVTTSNLDESLNAPIVMADNDAMARVQAMLWERWSKRRAFQFTAGYKWLALEPGDSINLEQQNGNLLPVRITQVQLDGKGCLQFNADFTVPSVYPTPGSSTYSAPQASSAQGVPQQQVPYSGPTILALMDVPPLRAQDATTPGLYLGACGMASDWAGAIVDISRDDVNFTQTLQALSAAVVGQAVSVLPTFSGGNIPDELNQVTVQLFDPQAELSSVPYTSFLNGANVAYLGGEIVFFRNAVQISANQWTLSGLLRGQIGTEARMSTHAVNEYFVLLSSTSIYPVSVNLADVGQELWFEPYLSSIMGTLPGAATSVTPANARLAPLAPHLLRAEPILNPASSFLVSWFRRARINYGWNDSADVPLDFGQESYRINVYNGSSQVNSYTLTSAGVSWNGGTAQAYPANPSGQVLPPFSYGSGRNQAYFVYTAAMASNDGFSSGNSITMTVSQIGDYGVPGGTASVTFTR